MGKYYDELKNAMDMLAKESNVIFIGQAVAYDGTAMTTTLKDVDKTKLLELPVAEELQMGMSIGMSLAGLIPVSIYPRWNFLLLAINQLVNHMDKLEKMSDGGFKPGVIVRVGVGSESPMFPSYQHIGDFTDAIQAMLTNIPIFEIIDPEHAVQYYSTALKLAKQGKSSIVVEWGDYYGTK